MIASRVVDSPLGPITMKATAKGIYGLDFGTHVQEKAQPQPLEQAQAEGWLSQLSAELAEYFAGQRQQFTVPLVPHGTEFQQQVWQALTTIPYGATESYRWLAEQVSRPRGFQAVGQANGRNPIAILIPCHRVINLNGRLGGYSGGLDKKEWLLAHEAR
ncbi:MAG: methylated-DNA--[protein]-cysteine S-methyltransferase [Aliidiomarina sp.]|uniref:methylated-DNA--[protein]-cysteine S-methyltransferase n=1 Tax=Aliidiomarina sp. TaxID=1872439 RepID=UPI0025C58166|nr:methylated-DNA--[protein]-cysteine S-methyltransferase [Aliidiomarina sp.]MCH8501322.1 methylated-DNA--[protein]-cysteine S-methyltransferase [Aliidiomarina sp.]